jgi:alpha-N-arabinofuranosidase
LNNFEDTLDNNGETLRPKTKSMKRSVQMAMRGLFLVLLAGFSGTALPDQLTLTVNADNPGDTISRYLYGQFAEHLGRGIYEGIWVGEESTIPNERGFRTDVIEALKELEIPVIRWPGGCFADEYDWRDGIGPRDERPVRINTHWGWVEETNAFGTHEFMELVELLGSEAYIAGNVGSGTPREMARWLEYMTATGNTEMAVLRRANGREQPWNVAFWGVGNETWGCGGNMTPAHYTDVFKRYSTFLKAPADNMPKKVASGGSDKDTSWTEALASGVPLDISYSNLIDGISHHYYTLPTGDWGAKGKATGFPETEWISTLHSTMRIDEYLALQAAVLDRHDPGGKVGIYLDEWGTWYDPEEGSQAGFLYQQNSLRDAVVAALNFNIFHRHTKRLHMANIAQTVNVLQAVILTDGDKMVRTPTYYAFQMYKPFKDATFIPLSFESMTEYTLGELSVPGVSASAAKTAEGDLVIALVNLDPEDPVDLQVALQGFQAESVTGRTLTAEAMDSHNTFEKPDAVIPRALDPVLLRNELSVALPARSVTVFRLQE